MNFREICDLFDGQRATARILNKDQAHVGCVCRGTKKLPDTWIPTLKLEARRRIPELRDETRLKIIEYREFLEHI